ncbi:NAD(P)H-dependent oxidoreductase [Nocardia sp. NPDC052566]|uniref:NAD(P)H-dependent oxidoreductase n=1 Tax=Nocardia sp. NPDC052566 TaxID=3364330 RepID=UPI0037C94E56
MRVAVYLAHPRMDSFNRAIFDGVVEELVGRGVEVVAHDLYAEGFGAVVSATETGTVEGGGSADEVVRRHQGELGGLDGMVFVHPNWWGMPPAVMVGWVQRVLAPGVAYQLDTAAGAPVGLLKVRRALVLNTSDTTVERERDVFGDPLQRIWAACVMPFIGVDDVRRKVFRTVGDSSADDRAAWLREARELAAALVDES